jgi:hypothetical protein
MRNRTWIFPISLHDIHPIETERLHLDDDNPRGNVWFFGLANIKCVGVTCAVLDEDRTHRLCHFQSQVLGKLLSGRGDRDNVNLGAILERGFLKVDTGAVIV